MERPIRDRTLQKLAIKDTEEKRSELDVRAPINLDENKPAGAIHVIPGGPSGNKGLQN